MDSELELEVAFELMLASILTNSPDPATREQAYLALMQAEKPAFPPLEALTCANVQPTLRSACDGLGKMACSGCRLVSYCSEACQKEHWKLHKQDCRSPLKSEGWLPSWVRERRPPVFLSCETPEEVISRRLNEGFNRGCALRTSNDNDATKNLNAAPVGTDTHLLLPSWVQEGRQPTFAGVESPTENLHQQPNAEFQGGLALWGNVPAMDVINLGANENEATKNLNVAFVASGDMRHVVKTINSLPSDFSGDLTILLNDITVPIACRNLTLLFVLGMIPDEVLAADVALHFWYSVFLPQEYRAQVYLAVSAALNKPPCNSTGTPLGKRSTVFISYPPEALPILENLKPGSKDSKPSALDAQIEYRRVTTAPSQRDYRDRMYARLRPSHRVSVQEYRRSGIVLPFGAPSFHFDCPNVSLFSPDGRWLQHDSSSHPLDGWDISDVISAGEAHGCRPEDIYGCLYFYLTEQLRMFAQRLREFSISFRLYSQEACGLALAIKSGLAELGLPSTVRFDRIHVSNILDVQYVGIDAVLTTWGPLLSASPFATILGYFMNWLLLEKEGDPATCGEEVINECIMRIRDRDEREMKLRARKSGRNPMPDSATFVQRGVMAMTMQALSAVHDNSKPFRAYLNKEGLPSILKRTRLQLKESHTIVPRRLRVPLQSPPNALPEFPDDESWYNYTNLNRYSWVERFVEFSRE